MLISTLVSRVQYLFITSHTWSQHVQVYQPNPNRICICSATKVSDVFQKNKEKTNTGDRLGVAFEAVAIQSEKAAPNIGD